MVEIIPKPKAKTPPWFNILFYFSISLLIIAILSFFILNQLQKKATFNLQNLDELLKNTKTQERINLEKELINYQKKTDDFSYLVKNHNLTSKLFDFLENITHPAVYFSSLSFSSENGIVVLRGGTENFQTLGQQLSIFKTEPLIKEVNLSEVSIGREGKINFTFTLSLLSEIFK